MQRITRRTIAYLLALSLLVPLLPVPAAYAQELETEIPTTVPVQTEPDMTAETMEPDLPEETETTIPEETQQTEPERQTVDWQYPQEIPDAFEAPVSYRSSSLSGLRSLPAAYDSRTAAAVTEVKDQRPWQLCWAFSALSVAESYLIRTGRGRTDLSERHLGCYFHGDAYDPLGNAAGDGTFLAEHYLDSGNNNKFTTFALANWVGGALESRYPYNQEPAQNRRELAMDDVVHLTNAYWINGQDTDNIKRYIIDNGSVGLSIYYQDSFYAPDTAAYYNDRYTATNHAITVVGWDDDYSAENFTVMPEGDGAWLCKNSLGPEFGQDGYFWLSYWDYAINRSAATAFVFEFASGTNYTWNYHYDGGFGTTVETLPSGGGVASVFTATGSAEGLDEQIRAVGFAVADADLRYSIQIYRDLQDPADPVSGTAVLASAQTGRTGLCGYYTIPLDAPVTVRHGETFSVVITLRNDSGAPIRCFVDKSYTNGSWIRFVSHTEAGQTYASDAGGNWSDLAEKRVAARVKAFSTELSSRTVSGLYFEQSAVLLTPGETFRQMPGKEPESADDCVLLWHSADESVAQVAQDGTVTAIDHGQTEITVSALDGRVTASFQVSVKPRIQSVYFRKTRPVMVVGETFVPLAEILPMEAAPYYTLELFSSDESVARILGDTVVAEAPGRAVITVRAGLAEASYSVTVTRSLEDAEVVAEPAAFLGSPVEPPVTVCLDGQLLEEGRDYTLSYRDNALPGTGTVTVTGTGLYSGQTTAEFAIAVPVPQGLSAENEEKGLRLFWEPIPGVAGYHLYRRKAGGSWQKLRSLTGWENNSWLDAGTSGGGAAYEYRVCVWVQQKKTTWIGAYSPELTFCRLTAPKLRKLTLSDTNLTISWDRISGADAYLILQSEEEGTPQVIGQTEKSVLSFVTERPPVGKILRYHVQAVKYREDQSFLSCLSGSRRICIPGKTVLQEPKNEVRGIALSWEPVEGATGYEVQRSTDGRRWNRAKTLTGTSWTDTSRSSGSRCFYRVVAQIKLDNVTYRAEPSGEVTAVRLGRPAIRKAAAGDGYSLTWGRIPGATGYRVFRQEEDGELVDLGVTEKLTFTDTTATKTGVLYTYFVRAEGETAVSALSEGKTLCTPDAPEPKMEAAGTGLRIFWEQVPLATGYEIYRSTDGIRWSRVRTLNKPDLTSWTDTGRNARRYRYRVVAVAKLKAATCPSAPSEELIWTP